MILRSLKVWLPVAITLVGVCSGTARAMAHDLIYPFTANYRTTINITPVEGDISQVFEVGFSDDAPYDLEKYEGLTYSAIDDEGNLTFNNNPETFGLEGYPLGYITFSGNGDNKLFGFSDATAALDLETLTGKGSGVVYITDGEGIFENATSTLSFSEEDTVDLGPPLTLNGLALVSGSIKVPHSVPEPTTTSVFIGMSLIGSVSLLRRRQSIG
jgi:hypothetical protein